MKAVMYPILKVVPRHRSDENQLHAACVELIALDDAEIKYSTVQNWFLAIKKGRVVYSTLSPNAGFVIPMRKYHGHKWKRVQQ